VIVLDTDVLSELMRPSPSPDVVTWVRSQHSATLYTTAVTVAEVRYGIAQLPDGRRKDQLGAVADDVFARLPGARPVLRRCGGRAVRRPHRQS